MEKSQFEILKQEIQEVIDLIAQKNFTEANFKIADAGELLDEILDLSDDDDDLIEISRYQVLINQLQQKINIASNL